MRQNVVDSQPLHSIQDILGTSFCGKRNEYLQQRHAHYSQRSFLSSLVSPFGMLQPNHVRGRSSPPAPMPWPC